MFENGIIEFPFRIGHEQFGMEQITLRLKNRDPQNWFAELEVGEKVGEFEWLVDVDNQQCAVWGTLKIQQLNPQEPRSPRFTIEAFDPRGQLLNDMDVVVDLVDSDGDGIPDVDDNCPKKSNKDQEDADEDRIGDRCDNCPRDFNPDQKDSNGNGRGDACDPLCDLPGDLDDDCDVDGKDLALLAADWLVGK